MTSIFPGGRIHILLAAEQCANFMGRKIRICSKSQATLSELNGTDVNPVDAELPPDLAKPGPQMRSSRCKWKGYRALLTIEHSSTQKDPSWLLMSCHPLSKPFWKTRLPGLVHKLISVPYSEWTFSWRNSKLHSSFSGTLVGFVMDHWTLIYPLEKVCVMDIWLPQNEDGLVEFFSTINAKSARKRFYLMR